MSLERRTKVSTVDVLDRVLDKGIVIDSHMDISVLGLGVIATIDARMVVASIETYLHHAADIGKLGILSEQMFPLTVPRR